MHFEQLEIPEVLLFSPVKHGDERGFFSETFRSEDWTAKRGPSAQFVQENHVYSAQKGVLRGLHFQLPPRSQGKLVRCIRGAIFDVAVDVRHGSPTFGRHVGRILSAQNWHQLWIPPGFAHGYITLEEHCEVIYKVTDYYAPEYDRGIAWNDPALRIDWLIAREKIILSEKDQRQPLLAEAPPAFHYN
jgi:dTDP-4-dehydrorhamnose 3,5-epimerase